MSLSSIEGYKLGADLEDVYQDFYNLGRIFQVEERAEELVNDMQAQIAAAEEAVTGQEATPVFVFDMAQEEGAYTCGNNFTSKLIEHAGGVNIFNDLDTTWATVSWETVVERAPEVIVINDYGDTSLEEKIAQLKENPALATVPAIQNDRIISVKLCEVFASSMTGDTVEKFARGLPPRLLRVRGRYEAVLQAGEDSHLSDLSGAGSGAPGIYHHRHRHRAGGHSLCRGVAGDVPPAGRPADRLGAPPGGGAGEHPEHRLVPAGPAGAAGGPGGGGPHPFRRGDAGIHQESAGRALCAGHLLRRLAGRGAGPC